MFEVLVSYRPIRNEDFERVSRKTFNYILDPWADIVRDLKEVTR